MTSTSSQPLKDQSALRWAFLEEMPDGCVVVSDRMEFVYVNAVARQLVGGDWFGKRCFEVMPTTDKTCAFHCQTMRAVSESPEIVYCEESVDAGTDAARVFGVGLIPLGARSVDHGRAVFVLRRKPVLGNPETFKAQLLRDAEQLRHQIETTLAASGPR